MVTLVAGLATLAVIAAAIAVVVLVRASDKQHNNAAAAAVSGLDTCVVGTWKAVSATTEVVFGGATTTVTSKGGDELRLRPDGTGVWDYHGGVTYRGTTGGIPVELTIRGKNLFRYRSVGTTVEVSDITGDTRAALVADGVPVLTEQVGQGDGSHRYTCAHDAFVLAWADESGSIEFTRASATT